MSDIWYAELYDDREPEKTMERQACRNEDDAYATARWMLKQWEDPDDGVRPLHLQSRVIHMS